MPAGNHDALAKAMIQMLSETQLKQHYQQQARIRAQDFHYLNISKQYLDFCNSLLVSGSKS